jgi:hypothetical protein
MSNTAVLGLILVAMLTASYLFMTTRLGAYFGHIVLGFTLIATVLGAWASFQQGFWQGIMASSAIPVAGFMLWVWGLAMKGPH